MRSETDSIANSDAAHVNASLVERATGLPLQGLAANASMETEVPGVASMPRTP
ncbi:hypothetical protein VDG39_11835 [Xanthomonas campestris pv. raphani]|uniref:hypothetical protein n=1 Tax=Xanthomonas campestris TaxID=339 RepID=UPI002B22BA35|nr:hypothetical protein [Xanthomonas campestris]MEA9811041.1 hypothetical protein [Xanthomonas campestris pv. raphani]MEA9913392.1 hypothetical protein [Xanthomonas campestris pv. raphani]